MDIWFGTRKVSVSEARVNVVRNFTCPVTKRDMRAFLGMVGYYQKVISKFADVLRTLTMVTKRMSPRQVVLTEKMNGDFVYSSSVVFQHPSAGGSRIPLPAS